MPDHILLCHPACTKPAADSLHVGSELSFSGGLILHYRIQALPDRLRLPAATTGGPADELWQHTCCEAFIAAGDGTAYREFNFSPSGQWAIYDFLSYRERAADYRPATPPRIAMQALRDGFLLRAELPPDLLPAAISWHVGLSAVIESAHGDKSYWALAHAAAQPDFHRRESFVLTLTQATP